MRNSLNFALAISAAVVGFHAASAMAQLVPYSRDFELPGTVQTDPNTLHDGWLVGANVFASDPGTYLGADTTVLRYNYFSFPAPNNPSFAAFSLIKTTSFEGTPPQGDQELVVISDYQNGDHGDPNDRIESLVFREQFIAASDVGKTAKFSFLAHKDAQADITATSTKANAFIKSLDPTFFFTKAKYSVETTALDSDPNNFVQMTLSLPITSDLQGDLLQFGFDNWASGFEASGVGYDVVDFSINDTFGSYTQDFEAETGTVAANPEALNNDGWRGFGAVFDSGNNFQFQYGPFGAPNGGSGFSSVASGQAGPSQGVQYLNTFSDYNCCGPGTTNQGHFNGTDIVESSIFQELLVGSADAGRQVEFKFDATLPTDPNAAYDPNQSFAQFYIRTIDPNNGFVTSAESLLDASTLGLSSSSWTSGSVLFDIDPNFVGHLIQFGITNRSSNFAPTGIFIDNVSFDDAVVSLDNADFDGDGVVSGLDFLILQQNLGLTGQIDNSNGDANGDGTVGSADLAIYEAQYGTSPLASAVTAVPEPSTLLLGSLAAGLLMRRRNR